MREEMRSHLLLAELAGPQHGVVSFRQLRRLGFSAPAIGRLSRAGRLHRVHRSVYAVGHFALSDHGHCLAAVLACGTGAVLSHAAAARIWGLRPALAKPVDVTVPSHGQRRRGIALHHSCTLSASEHGRLSSIPITALPRTLLDVAAVSPKRELNDAVERAERLDLLDIAAIDSMLHRRRGDRGAARLRLATEIYRVPVFSRARSERLFLEMAQAAELPPPAINTWVEKFEIDVYWEAERFAVEVDGWEAHGNRQAFEADHLRWEQMKLAGIEVLPISARRIEQAPGELGRHLTTLLGRRRRELRRRR
jgi:predicted transcriptional regulator of viral defense system